MADETDPAAQLREARKAAGLTQSEVARRVGVSEKTVRRWEVDGLITKDRDRRAVERLYGITLDREPEERPAKIVSRGAANTDWTPNPALRGSIPARAYEVAIGYCRRLALAGLPTKEIERAERLMIERRYAQRVGIHVRGRGEVARRERRQAVSVALSAAGYRRRLAALALMALGATVACSPTEPAIQRVQGTYSLVSVNGIKVPGAITSSCCVPIQVYAGLLIVTDSTWHAEACLDATCSPELLWVRDGWVDGRDAVGPIGQRTAKSPMMFADFTDGGLIYPMYSGGTLSLSIPTYTNYFAGETMVFQQE